MYEVEKIKDIHINWENIYDEYYIAKKLSPRKIANILKIVSPATIKRKFKALTLKLRNKSEAQWKGNKSPNWKNRLHYDKIHGRVLRYIAPKKYIQESVYQYLKHNNLKKIPVGYVIHHEDFDKLNNAIDNLILMTRSAHTILHNKGKGD